MSTKSGLVGFSGGPWRRVISEVFKLFFSKPFGKALEFPDPLDESAETEERIEDDKLKAIIFDFVVDWPGLFWMTHEHCAEI